MAQLLPAPAFWFTMLSGRKCSPSGDARSISITPVSRSRGTVRETYSPSGPREKYVHVVELRAVVELYVVIVVKLCIAGI
jgi:hypothetical protein